MKNYYDICTMKLFEINTGDVWDVAARTKEEAIDHYLFEEGWEHEEIEVDSVREIPESEWSTIMVSFDEYDEDGQVKIPMSELIKNQTEPQIMSSTAWLVD